MSEAPVVGRERLKHILFEGSLGGVIFGMQMFLKRFVFALCCLCVLPARADLLDQMTSPQVATTNIGKAVDSTTITALQTKSSWSSRTFTAEGTSRCSTAKKSSVGIASAGTGITNVEMKNGKGQVTITWRFGSGISMSDFPHAGVEFDLVNTSNNREIKIRTVANLATTPRAISLGYPGVRVAQKLSPQGKTVSFNFQKSSPMLFNDPSVLVRSFTLTLSAPSTCDTAFGLQSVRWLPRGGAPTTLPPKSSGRGKNKGSPPAYGTVPPTESPVPNPCDEDPEVPQKIKDCEERRNWIASGCAKWTCECSPSLDRKTYYISSSSYLSGRDTAGNDCSNNTCGGGAGRCTDFGECIPAQFYGYDNPSISIDADGVSFRQGKPETRMNTECIDMSKLPRGKDLCDLTIPQVEAMVLNSITVGAKCELSPGKNGVCSNTSQCVPDVTSDRYCEDQRECAPCGIPGSGNICRSGKCLTIKEATRKLCEATVVLGGYGQGICSQCFGTFKLLEDGTCGLGARPNDQRGVSMEGAPCSRKGIPQGMCRAGSCVPNTPPSPSPVSSPQG